MIDAQIAEEYLDDTFSEEHAGAVQDLQQLRFTGQRSGGFLMAFLDCDGNFTLDGSALPGLHAALDLTYGRSALSTPMIMSTLRAGL